jgi:hypothetical protein
VSSVTYRKYNIVGLGFGTSSCGSRWESDRKPAGVGGSGMKKSVPSRPLLCTMTVKPVNIIAVIYCVRKGN